MPTAPSLYHAIPLHYLPYLFHTGALLSATQLAAGNRPISPRPSAIRRKRHLGLADFVHLSLVSKTPLLRDKRRKGYPHALLAFPRAVVLALPGVALLRYNTKRWAHRDDFVPVTGEGEKAAVFAEHAAGKYPSLEVLVPRALPVALAAMLHFAGDADASVLRPLLARIGVPQCVSPGLFPATDAVFDLGAVAAYVQECESAGGVLPPPALAFD